MKDHKRIDVVAKVALYKTNLIENKSMKDDVKALKIKAKL